MAMDTTWIQTAICISALGMVFYYMRNNRVELKKEMKEMKTSLEEKIAAVDTRLGKDEDDYMTKEVHTHMCGQNTSELKLHINNVVAQQRKDMDGKFEEMFRKLDSITNCIQRNKTIANEGLV